MGKGGGTPSIKIGPLEKEQAAFLKSQRSGIIEPTQAALFQPALSAATQAFNTGLSPRDRGALEGQYNQARENILQRSTRGGLMNKMLTTADLARAESVGNATNQARQLGIERGLGLLGGAAFPSANNIVGGGQAAAQSEQQRRQAQAQMAAQNQAAQGQGLSSTLGSIATIGSLAYMMF
jgi:hypothetical protein